MGRIVLLQGHGNTSSRRVAAATPAVTAGQIVEFVSGATTVRQGQANSESVAGIAINNAAAGELVTFIVANALVNANLDTSQTITVGAHLQAGVGGTVRILDKTTISATPTQAEIQGVQNAQWRRIGRAVEAKTTTTTSAPIKIELTRN